MLSRLLLLLLLLLHHEQLLLGVRALRVRQLALPVLRLLLGVQVPGIVARERGSLLCIISSHHAIRLSMLRSKHRRIGLKRHGCSTLKTEQQ